MSDAVDSPYGARLAGCVPEKHIDAIRVDCAIFKRLRIASMPTAVPQITDMGWSGSLYVFSSSPLGWSQMTPAQFSHTKP